MDTPTLSSPFDEVDRLENALDLAGERIHPLEEALATVQEERRRLHLQLCEVRAVATHRRAA